jgi:hypothetical protein
VDIKTQSAEVRLKIPLSQNANFAGKESTQIAVTTFCTRSVAGLLDGFTEIAKSQWSKLKMEAEQIKQCRKAARNLAGMFYCSACQRFKEDLCKLGKDKTDLSKQGL